MRVAIQGERGSNSHMAVLEVMHGGEGAAADYEVISYALSAEVFEALDAGLVDRAVLPIENSLHGSVAEHFDLLLKHPVHITAERTMRIRHNIIVSPGVDWGQVRRVLSHPVALAQCREWLRAHPEIEAVPFYDTAGSVKHIVEAGLTDAAGIAPELAADVYGGQVLFWGVEDHAENYTRFLVLEPGDPRAVGAPDKVSVAFSLEHRPGALMEALEAFRREGLNLMKLESRPVPGRPWEYVFFVDARFGDEAEVDRAREELVKRCGMVKELGRYRAG